MRSRTFIVEVVQQIEVTVDEDKFTDEFLSDFRETFYQFDTVEDHVEHLAQLEARGLIDLVTFPDTFIEGYGEASDMGIEARDLRKTTMEIVNDPA